MKTSYFCTVRDITERSSIIARPFPGQLYGPWSMLAFRDLLRGWVLTHREGHESAFIEDQLWFRAPTLGNEIIRLDEIAFIYATRRQN